MCRGIKWLGGYWPVLQIESLVFPQIFLQPRMQRRGKQVFKYRRPYPGILDDGRYNSCLELGGIHFQKLAEFERIHVLHLCWNDHQIVHNSIVQDCATLAVINYSPRWV